MNNQNFEVKFSNPILPFRESFSSTGILKAGGLSKIFLSLGPVVKGLELRSALYRWGGEEDDEEMKTFNHGWCRPPQSLWPALL